MENRMKKFMEESAMENKKKFMEYLKEL